jgi:nitrous oxide reductase accessory protein NosL
MKKTVTLALAATLLVAGGTAIAQSSTSKPEVVEKDAKGHATKVSIDGQVYPVCTATVTDGCVNPRQAGLKSGNSPMNNWPGHPASEKPAQ